MKALTRGHVQEGKLLGVTRFVPGDRVRMSGALKTAMLRNGSSEHVYEFGKCVGVVIGLTRWSDAVEGPEIDVRWLPSRLRYAYLPRLLIPADAPRKKRKKPKKTGS